MVAAKRPECSVESALNWKAIVELYLISQANYHYPGLKAFQEI